MKSKIEHMLIVYFVTPHPPPLPPSPTLNGALYLNFKVSVL
jgi:hypothetical protein